MVIGAQPTMAGTGQIALLLDKRGLLETRM